MISFPEIIQNIYIVYYFQYIIFVNCSLLTISSDLPMWKDLKNNDISKQPQISSNRERSGTQKFGKYNPGLSVDNPHNRSTR